MKDRIIQPILAVIGGFCGFLYGDLNGLFYALLLFIVMDYITGILSAIALKKVSSKIGSRGIVKKVFILIIIAVAHIIDVNIIGNGAVVMTAVEFFYIANEGISILENGGKMGMKYPPKLLAILEQLKNESEEK